MNVENMSAMQKTILVLQEAGVKPDIITAFITTWAIFTVTKEKKQFENEFDQFKDYFGEDLFTHMKLYFFKYQDYLFDYALQHAFGLEKPNISDYV